MPRLQHIYKPRRRGLARLLTVRTGTVSGKPARNMAMRASLARWLDGPSTLPTTMSPTACIMSEAFEIRAHTREGSCATRHQLAAGGPHSARDAAQLAGFLLASNQARTGHNILSVVS